MPVFYSWAPNPVRPGTYYPRTRRQGTSRTPELADNIARRTVIQPVDVRAVLEALSDEIVDALLAGRGVIVDDLLGFSLSLELKDPKLAHDPSVPLSREDVAARVKVSAKPAMVRRVDKRLVIEQTTTRPRVPRIRQVYDHATKNYDKYTNGGVIDLVGGELHLPADFEEDPEQGVFFISKAGKTTRGDVYVKYGSKKITCVVPATVNGVVTIEVRTTYGAPKLRSGKIDGISPA